MKAIYFDMDGTIANLYGFPNWLELLTSENATPYKKATVLLNMNVLARRLNILQKRGYHIGIVSWLSKTGSNEYGEAVTAAKLQWLNKHLHSVQFNEIKIVKYGIPKENIVQFPKGILFDDEEKNRKSWKGRAYDVNNILDILKELEWFSNSFSF